MATKPSPQMEFLLERAARTKRTQPPDKMGESISTIEVWQMVWECQQQINANMPGVPIDIRNALAERETFKAFWGSDDIKLLDDALKSPAVQAPASLSAEPTSKIREAPSVNTSAKGQETQHILPLQSSNGILSDAPKAVQSQPSNIQRAMGLARAHGPQAVTAQENTSLMHPIPSRPPTGPAAHGLQTVTTQENTVLIHPIPSRPPTGPAVQQQDIPRGPRNLKVDDNPITVVPEPILFLSRGAEDAIYGPDSEYIRPVREQLPLVSIVRGYYSQNRDIGLVFKPRRDKTYTALEQLGFEAQVRAARRGFGAYQQLELSNTSLPRLDEFFYAHKELFAWEKPDLIDRSECDRMTLKRSRSPSFKSHVHEQRTDSVRQILFHAPNAGAAIRGREGVNISKLRNLLPMVKLFSEPHKRSLAVWFELALPRGTTWKTLSTGQRREFEAQMTAVHLAFQAYQQLDGPQVKLPGLDRFMRSNGALFDWQKTTSSTERRRSRSPIRHRQSYRDRF